MDLGNKNIKKEIIILNNIKEIIMDRMRWTIEIEKNNILEETLNIIDLKVKSTYQIKTISIIKKTTNTIIINDNNIDQEITKTILKIEKK